MTNRWQGWVTGSQRDSSDGGDGRDEVGDQFFVGDIQDGGWEDLTLVVDLDNSQTVSERRDVQQVQQRGFRWTDSVTGFNDLNVRDNFNGTSPSLLLVLTMSLPNKCTKSERL